MVEQNILQEQLEKYEKVLNCEIGILDIKGIIVACTNKKNIGKYQQIKQEILYNENNIFVMEAKTYLKVYIKDKFDFIVFVSAVGLQIETYIKMIAISLVDIKLFMENRYDKREFIKNIIFGNIRNEDILIKTKELNVNYNAKRIIYIIDTEESIDLQPGKLLVDYFQISKRLCNSC